MAFTSIALSGSQRFVLFVVLCVVAYYIPVLNIPLLWVEVFFHEISHGIAALLSGGSIVSIHLLFNGSGYCVTQGGNAFLIGFSGYAGSALWGLMIYLVSECLSRKASTYAVGLLVILLGLTLILWVRDLLTLLVIATLIFALGFILFNSRYKFINHVLGFLGVFVMLDAVRSPLVLLDGVSIGDGAALANSYGMPEFFWVLVWFLISLMCIYIAWRMSSKS